MVRLLAYNDTEAAHDDPERVARLVESVAARRDEETVVVGGGDDVAVGGTSLHSAAGFAVARPTLDALRPDATALGNHELSEGIERAVEWIESQSTPYLCANLASPDSPLADAVRETVVRRVGGDRVGFTGLLHPEGVRFAGVADEVSLADPVAAAEREARRLRERGVDRLVVCSHCGDRDPAVARTVDEVTRGDPPAVVVGGHVPTRRARWVGETLLVRTEGGGRVVAEATVDGEQTDRPPVRFHRVADAPLDPATDTDDVRRAVTQYQREAGVARSVAQVREPVTRDRTDRAGESRVGNWLADAVRAATDASVALCPSGLPRVGPPLAGEVSAAEIAGLAPFPDRVATFRLGGSRLRATVERRAMPADAGYVRFHPSGLQVRLAPDGSLRSLRVAGDPVDPDRTYRVASTAYLAETDAFEAFTHDRLVERHGSLSDAPIGYADRVGVAPDAGDRVAWAE